MILEELKPRERIEIIDTTASLIAGRKSFLGTLGDLLKNQQLKLQWKTYKEWSYLSNFETGQNIDTEKGLTVTQNLVKNHQFTRVYKIF